MQAAADADADADADAAASGIYGLPEGCTIGGGQNTGDEYSMGTSGTLFHVHAYSYEVDSPMTVHAVQIHTGDWARASRVGIWSHDEGPWAPGTEEVGADFETREEDGWQGAMLPTVETYLAGDTIWVSWHTTPGKASVGTTGTIVEYRWADVGSTSWNGPFTDKTKFRLLNCD